MNFNEWKYVEFQKILANPIRNGLSKPKRVRGEGVKFINMGELFKYDRIYDIKTDRVPVTEKELENAKIIKKDLIFARQSLVASGAGKCSIVMEVNEDTVFESHLIRARVNGKIADAMFYYYYFSSSLGKKHMATIVNQVAAAGIRGSDLKKLIVPLPELKEQNKISKLVSSIDSKIEINNKINKNLEQQAQAIFKHWFIDFEFENEDGNPYKSSGGEMMESELGMMPKGWEIKKIKEISKDIVLGKTPKTSDEDNFGGYMPFLTIPDMHNKLYVDSTARTLTKKGINTQLNKTVPKNSICVSCIATPGLVSITKESTQTNQQINTILPSIEYTYVYSLMKSISDKIISLGSGGTTTNNLNKTQFSNIYILVPSPKYRRNYHELAETLFNMILINQQQNQKLSQLRETLLPKLMSGEIRIPLD